MIEDITEFLVALDLACDSSPGIYYLADSPTSRSLPGGSRVGLDLLEKRKRASITKYTKDNYRILCVLRVLMIDGLAKFYPILRHSM